MLDKPKTSSPKRDAAIRYIQATEALTGEIPSEKEIAAGARCSKATANEALQIIRNSVGKIRITKATKEHIGAAARRRARELEAIFDERVRATMVENSKAYLTQLEEMEKEARDQKETYERLVNNHKPLFSEAEFLIILTCLHPDNSASEEKRNIAFGAFNTMKFQLTGKR